MSKRSFGNDGNPASAPKFDKSQTRTPQRGGYPKMRSHERLAGGADARSKSSVNVNASKTHVDATPKVTPVASGVSRVAAEAAEEIEAILSESSNQLTESTGDKKVDEMIDYVIQNLQEAGKALASLGENFEHDLKLVFVDVMAKVQNWVGLAELRLGTAKTDLKGLHRELVARSNEIATRNHEITELRVKLAESEVAKNVYEKALTENVQRGGGPIPSPSTMTFVPSRQPMPVGEASAHSAHSAADSHLRTADVGGVSTHSALPSTQPVDVGGVSTHSAVPSTHPVGAGMTSSQGILPDGSSTYPDGAGEAAGGLGLTASAATLLRMQKSTAEGLQAAQDEASRAQLASHPTGSQPPGSKPPESTMRSQIREAGAPVTADVAVQSGKGKERGKRESELESELARLRKENEKIVKERADYENAIQRALLRGVSSLNVETLRVLRCPPAATCYTPCGPPPSPVNTVEALVACSPKKTKDNWTPSGCRTTMSGLPRRGGTRVRANSTVPEREHDCCGKRPDTSSSRLSPRHRQSSATSTPSMLLLLPKSDPPKVCVRTNTSQNRCGRAKSRKLESSVCMRKVG